MRRLSDLISFSDQLTMRAISSDEIQQRYKEFNSAASLSGDIQQSLRDGLNSIDTKSTAVLQHVSIMIAVTTLLFSQSKGLIKATFGFEMLVYVTLALFCLRLLMHQQISPSFNAYQDLAARDAIFERVSGSAYVVTILLILTFAIEIFIQ